ncbi:MAG: Na(+)/glucose symporter [Verrucomicrobiota bacterium]|jgi:cyclically-permuted mutarotase family protein
MISCLSESCLGSRRAITAFLLLSIATALEAGAAFTWEKFPALPPSPGQPTQPGVAGPFAGVHRDALIVAGGANFPQRAPWDGGAKIWWDDVFVLEGLSTGRPRWADQTFKLPRALGYGMSFNTPEGVVCVGGNDAEACYREVFLLSWDSRTQTLATSPLPLLPEPLANMAGAMIGQTIYVAGGQHSMKDPTPSNCFWSLDLSRRERPGDFRWQVLPTWPGPPRVLPVAVAQPSGGRFYLFSGRVPHPGQATKILTDAYAYDPARQTWQALRNINGEGRSGEDGWSVMAGVAMAHGDGELLVVGGDRGDLFLRLEQLDSEIATRQRSASTASTPERSKLNAEINERIRAKRALYESHPGFASEVLAYDPTRDRWTVAGKIPQAAQVTTIGVPWRGGLIIPSGEIRPGVRTPDIIHSKLPATP